MDSVKKVINLYLTECSGGDLYNRSHKYREASEALKEKINTFGDENTKLEQAVDELLALTERLSFEDGFQAGIKHIVGLVELAGK